MSDFYIRSPGLAALKTTFDNLCSVAGITSFVDPTAGVVSGTVVVGSIRFDVDVIPSLMSTPTTDRGLHCNLRITTHGTGPDIEAQIAAFRTAVFGQIAGQSLVLDVLPAAVTLAYGAVGQSYRTNASSVVFINPAPTVPKRAWA